MLVVKEEKEGITKVSRIDLLGIMNVWSKCHSIFSMFNINHQCRLQCIFTNLTLMYVLTHMDIMSCVCMLFLLCCSASHYFFSSAFWSIQLQLFVEMYRDNCGTKVAQINNEQMHMIKHTIHMKKVKNKSKSQSRKQHVMY